MKLSCSRPPSARLEALHNKKEEGTKHKIKYADARKVSQYRVKQHALIPAQNFIYSECPAEGDESNRPQQNFYRIRKNIFVIFWIFLKFCVNI